MSGTSAEFNGETACMLAGKTVILEAKKGEEVNTYCVNKDTGLVSGYNVGVMYSETAK